MERFNHKNLSNVELKELYHVKISNRFEVMENLDDDVNIKRAWESITGNIKASATESLGYCKLELHTPWSDEQCKMWN
jgi:hypothetical protein